MTPRESGLRVLTINLWYQARITLEQLAADMIQIWWRNIVAKLHGINRLSKQQQKMDVYDLLMRFRRARQESQVDIDDCSGTSAKIDSVSARRVLFGICKLCFETRW